MTLGGGFIRTTLADYVRRAGGTISEGTPITLEYVPAIRPPAYEQSFKQDEWICDVDLQASISGYEPRCLTTCYDKIVRIWDHKGSLVAESPSEANGGLSKRPNTGKWLSPTRIAAGGLGGKIVIFDCSGPQASSNEKKGKIKPVFELEGHTRMINDLSTHQATNRILTASRDGHIGLWAGDLESSPDAPVRRISGNRPATKRTRPSVSLPVKGPLSLIKVSKEEEAIHQAIFHPHDPTVAYTVGRDNGMDSSLHTVDLTTQKIVMTPFSGWDTLTSIAPLTGNGSSSALLAVGTTADCSVKIVDPRVSTSETPQKSAVMTLKGHKNRVVSVAGSPTVDWALVSGSWDSKCMVWDLRGRGSLSIGGAQTAEGEEIGGGAGNGFKKWTIPREHLKGKKVVPYDSKNMVLRVRWHRDWGIVSSGQTGPEGRDGLLQINSCEVNEY